MRDMSLMHAQFAADDTGAPPKTTAVTKYLIFFLLIGILLVAVALYMIHPYRRAEKLAADILARQAPPGTTVSGISVAFPLNIVLTDLSVPIQVKDQQRQLMVKEASGRVAILPLLGGTVDAGMNADFFGGTLWLDLKTDNPAKSNPDNLSLFAFDARAREIDLGALCTFLDSSVLLSGVCNADAEGELDERNPATLKGQALFIGEDVAIPPLLIKGLIFPENSDVKFTAKLSAKNGTLFIEKLRLNGTAYKLSGKGEVKISEPLEHSPVSGSFSMVFHEPPIIIEERVADVGGEDIMDTLVESGAEIFFTVDGLARRPDVRLDPKTSLGSLLEKSSR